MEVHEFNEQRSEFNVRAERISYTSHYSFDGKQTSAIAVQFRYHQSRKFLSRLSHSNRSSETLVHNVSTVEEATCIFDMSDFSNSPPLTEILFDTLYESFGLILEDGDLDSVVNKIVRVSGLDLNACGCQIKIATVEVDIQGEHTMVRCEECMGMNVFIEMPEFEAVNRFVPASESSIKKLKRVRIMAEDDEEEHQDKKRRRKSSKNEGGNVGVKASDSCSICLDEFISRGKYAAQMPCSHAFHEECIEGWLRRSHYCPLCRLEMPPAGCGSMSPPTVYCT